MQHESLACHMLTIIQVRTQLYSGAASLPFSSCVFPLAGERKLDFFLFRPRHTRLPGHETIN